MEIKIVKSIPQWIISSDIAAYHPFTKTIWIKSGMGLMFIPTLFHEIGHWVIHKIFNNNKKYHKKWDMTTIGFGNLNYSKEINRNVKLLVVVK